MEHESDGETNCNWCILNNPPKISTGTETLRNKRKSGDHPDYRIIKIGQNTEMNPGNLGRLAVTQIPVGNYKLTLVWKTPKR